MTYIDHRINKRMSQFWPVSHEQQALSAIQIVEAAKGIIQHIWGGDPLIAESNLEARKQEAIRKLFSICPLEVYVLHDNEHEIDKQGMRDALDEGFEAMLDEKRGIDELALGCVDIFMILVRTGRDRFLGPCHTFDYDEKPSEYFLGGDVQYLGHASSARAAFKLLKRDGYFQKD